MKRLILVGVMILALALSPTLYAGGFGHTYPLGGGTVTISK